MVKINKQKRIGVAPQRRTQWLLLASVVAVLALAVTAYMLHRPSVTDKARNTDKQSEAADADVDANKERLGEAEKDTADNTPPPSSSSMQVVISYAQATGNTVQVGAYVSGIFEDGGTCTLTLTRQSQTVTRTVTGIADATHTTCPAFTVDNSGHAALAAGSWQAKVMYTSLTRGESSSQATTIEVP